MEFRKTPSFLKSGRILFCLFLLFSFRIYSIPAPILSEGRIEPWSTYKRSWLRVMELTESSLQSDKEPLLKEDPVFWIAFLGSPYFDTLPLFLIADPLLKSTLELADSPYFTYQEIQNSLLNKSHRKQFATLLIQEKFLKAFNRHPIEKQILTEIANDLVVKKENDQLLLLSIPNHPLFTDFVRQDTIPFRSTPLLSASQLLEKLLFYESMGNQGQALFMLPKKTPFILWTPLQSLDNEQANFTPWNENDFLAVKSTYQNIKKALSAKDKLKAHEQKKELFTLLGTLYNKTTRLPAMPSPLQLQLETIYFEIPWQILALSCTLLALFFTRWSFPLTFLLFTLFSLQLLFRIFILHRPPVANMEETLLYVPWVILLFSLLFYLIKKQQTLLWTGLVATLLLLFTKIVGGFTDSLSPVQPVLNSTFWLTVHVLLVVASYGTFIFAGVLGHFYLLFPSRQKNDLLLLTLYIGVTLLTLGTLLGAIWANQSWGRFWDWDPKESWAFISICLYLLVIHAYRFHLIRGWGLSMGAVIGLLSITFTWYGVNYLLGVGLHSYGFGERQTFGYLGYFIFELLFIVSVAVKSRYLKTTYQNKF